METILKNIQDLIPQKAPFVMVTELISYGEEELVAGFEVLEDNILVSERMLSEAGIIENMAQSVALHTGYQYFLLKKEPPTGYLGAIKKIEISRLPKVGEFLETTITMLQEFMGISLVQITVNIGGELIATGQMKTVLAS
ncbi:MAG: hypothetical protein JKY08_04745 [Flavobacteriaceae bacterium]|nr:hypothetical protein [Flavobacteriaceae bacterium]